MIGDRAFLRRAIVVVSAAACVFGGCSEDSDSTGRGGGGTGGTGGSSGAPAGGGGMPGGTGGGGGGGVPGAPDVDPTKDVGELTDADKGALCDWSQGIRGGYGHETDCGNQIIMRTYDNQAQCMLIEFPADCGLTVLEWEICADAQVETNGCEFPPECEVVRDC